MANLTLRHPPTIRPAPAPKNLVLVIDDQSTSRTILQEIVLSIDNDVKVVAFEKPEEAIDWAKQNRPDMVVTDYKMPSMDGIEVIRQLRRIFYCAEIPILMITIVEDRDIRYLALESGATDFLTKPVDQYECRARCRNLLTLRRSQLLLKDRTQQLETQVNEATRAIRNREEETLLRLARVGEYRDEETGDHIIRVGKYARLIAEALGLTEEECSIIEAAAPLHDIGKVGLPDSILRKPGLLTPEEHKMAQQHTLIGHEILKGGPSQYLRMGALIALGHHEKYDGSGYPTGLSGDHIPLPARITAVVDVYDAMLSARAYRAAHSHEDAFEYLRASKGTHFDPECVTAFVAQLSKIKDIQSLYNNESLISSLSD